ncbi:hypothetical protein [Rhodoplanes roseus]|uniref:HepT-like domain-containing protein n=1 Tax=Rhodoplanes roseus TaxID=29409 RepID=A0A327L333_9BRAD|nr:hypothetical protein [Rhodoplanes roseus]RAI44594.1 hypothetical protein CH341_08160 [Rhodoplanes roseus]
MRGTCVDIENELADVAREVGLLEAGVTLVREAREGTDPAWTWLAVQGLASGVEKIYTGCERIMGLIAAEIDGARIERSESWHASLLKRMSHPFPGVRDAVISETCFAALDRLRAFRHRQRNSYGFVLDVGIVLERATQTGPAFEQFRSDVTALLDRLRAAGRG